MLVFAAAAIPVGAALAKAPVSVTIDGPGLGTGIEITQPDTLEAFMGLTGSRILTRPEVGDSFYSVAIGIGDPTTGEVFATNVFHYYPDPQGGRGYVLFIDVAGGSSSAEGQWFRAASAGEQALHEVLAGYGISIANGEISLPVAAAAGAGKTAGKPDTGSPASVPAAAETSDPAIAASDSWMVITAALGGLTILLVASALVIGQRRQAQI
jgi:hypothetical protein